MTERTSSVVAKTVLQENQITDVSPLVAITWLRELNLQENQIDKYSLWCFDPMVETGLKIWTDAGNYLL